MINWNYYYLPHLHVLQSNPHLIIFICKMAQTAKIAFLLIYISSSKTVYWITCSSFSLDLMPQLLHLRADCEGFGIWYPLALYWSWAEPSQVSTGMLEQAASLDGQLAPGPLPAGEVLCQSQCNQAHLSKLLRLLLLPCVFNESVTLLLWVNKQNAFTLTGVTEKDILLCVESPVYVLYIFSTFFDLPQFLAELLTFCVIYSLVHCVVFYACVCLYVCFLCWLIGCAG